MRRILVALLALSSIGMFAARASTFSTNAEDVATFNPPVSISTPTTNGCDPTLIPSPLILRTTGNGTNALHFLQPPPAPAQFDGQLYDRSVQIRSLPVQDQANNNAYVTFRLTDVIQPAGCGYRILGTVQLRIIAELQGLFVNPPSLEVGLAACPPNAPLTTTAGPSPTDNCTFLAIASAPFPGGNNRMDVSFGAIDAVVPVGQQLRMKVVSRRPGDPNVSLGSSQLAFGYTSSYTAQLEIGPPLP